jgi:hypothetical protein
MGPATCVLPSLPGDSDAGMGLKPSALRREEISRQITWLWYVEQAAVSQQIVSGGSNEWLNRREGEQEGVQN